MPILLLGTGLTLSGTLTQFVILKWLQRLGGEQRRSWRRRHQARLVTFAHDDAVNFSSYSDAGRRPS